jgi:dimethylargininase
MPAKPRVFDFTSALARAPGRSVVAGLRANDGPAPDYAAVFREHQAYVGALRQAGVEVTVLEPLEAFPDSMFVEDPALVFTGAAVLLSPGAPSRREEAHELSAALTTRFGTVLKLREGSADGGDVLVTPREILIGLSARTDSVGAKALQGLLQSLGRASRVVATPRGTLHLKSDCSLIDEETVLATDELADSGLFDGYRILRAPAPERDAANALRVNETLLVRADRPRTGELLAKLAVPVIALPVAEIAKLDAGLSCMSLRWFDPRAA